MAVPKWSQIGAKVEAALQGGPNTTSNNHDNNLLNRSVVVVGHGNVALDCARVLAKGGTGLKDTDVASHVLPILQGGVGHVTVVGRRGHVQGAFTIKEVRELHALQAEGHDVSFRVQSEELDLGGLTPASQTELEQRPQQRLDKLLRQVAKDNHNDNDSTTPCPPKRIDLRFLTNPVSWEADPSDATRISAVICERTKLVGPPGQQRAVGTGQLERIPADLALLSIGYKAQAVPGLEPYWNAETGTIRQTGGGGRVAAPTSELGGLYVAGWLKRGPSGIIGTNIPDAKETVAAILHDLQQQQQEDEDTAMNERPGSIATLLHERGIPIVSWEAYQRIHAKETAPDHKRSPHQPREKITNLQKQLETALSPQTPPNEEE